MESIKRQLKTKGILKMKKILALVIVCVAVMAAAVACDDGISEIKDFEAPDFTIDGKPSIKER